LRRTRPLDLVLPLLIVGGLSYLWLRAYYESIPPLQLLISLPLFVLAVFELELARRVRLAVRHDPHAKPMHAIAIARGVALGKASALGGAGVAGAAGALLLRVLPHAQDVNAAGNDARVGAVLLVAAVLLLAAGLLLERAGLDPNRDRDERSGRADRAA
jgi:hypothetical protein